MNVITDHWQALAYSLIGMALFGYALNKLAMWAINWCIARVDTAYAQGDAADDKLLTAFMKFTLAFFVWVEEKFGTDWPTKLEANLAAWCALIPVLPIRLLVSANTGKIIELAKKVYALGKQAAAKEVKEHDVF